jgi:hypothetical protein
MYNKLLNDSSLYLLLLDIDKEIAAKVRQIGCPKCKGPLDAAPYTRKPRGLPEGMPEELTIRFSFCCRVEGCRKRQTPKSVRFAGRKVWLAAVITVLSGGSSPASARSFASSLGTGPRTLRRWRHWWNKKFAPSTFWRLAKARFSPPVDNDNLPRCILARFAGQHRTLMEALMSCLRFLAPGWNFVQVI